MAINPEQVKNQEFPVRMKGYDPECVRRFLTEVAAAYRATIRDQGAQWALANISDDLAGVVRAAHAAAERVVSQAEAEAADLKARAEADAADRQARADAHLAQARADAEREAEHLRIKARDEIAEMRRQAMDDAERIRAEAQADATQRLAQADSEAAEVRRSARDDARIQVQAVMNDAMARVEHLQATERALEERIRSTHAEFGQLTQRLGANATIDLTEPDPVVIIEDRYQIPTGRADGQRGHVDGTGTHTGEHRAHVDGARAHTNETSSYADGDNGQTNGHAGRLAGSAIATSDPVDGELSADELTQFVRDLQFGTPLPGAAITPSTPANGRGRVDRTTVQRMVSAAVDRALAHSQA